MPEISFNINTSQYVRNLVGTWRAMRDASLAALDDAGDYIIDEMKDRIEESSPSGIIYHYRTSAGPFQKHFPLTTKVTKYGTHQASAPGEPPAILSGDLLQSFNKKTYFSRGHTRVIVEIVNEAPYASYMEYGTVSTGWGGPILPRPFMSPIIYSPEVNHRVLLIVRANMIRAGQRYGAR